jgi:starch phosphorylase
MNLKSDESAALDTGAFGDALRRQVRYRYGKRFANATGRDLLDAVCLACREWVVDRMLATEQRVREHDPKRVYYLSLEFLIGRSLESSLLNLQATAGVRGALLQLGVDLDALCTSEPDAGLGNGGLGRLAACFLDSLATLDMPGYGYGINYEHGLFRQVISGDEQQELPDSWQRLGSPWLIARPEESVGVPVYGRAGRRPQREQRGSWVDWRVIVGMPHDLPIVGYGGRTVNWLRLYSAGTADEFDVALFNRGDYQRAVERKLATERISKVLYPSASSDAGRELRLLQEYFFVACALRDVMRRFLDSQRRFAELPDKVALQLNDTHPVLGIAELMRLLVDEHEVSFDDAFEITSRTFSYTNHTLLPEALEKWPRPLLSRVLPRHLQIIEEINASFLGSVEARWPGDVDRLRRMSIIEEGSPKQLRMAHLAIVGSHAVNGVSELHSTLVRERLVPDFAEMWPDRFSNVTNGVTPRRWLLQSNPGLASLVTQRIGDGWIRDLGALSELEPAVEDAAFRDALRAVKRANKERLAGVVKETTGQVIDPASLFDVHIKRIHMYKRQLLAALHAIHLYQRIVEDGEVLEAPRTCIFAGKAAPEYHLAKLVIRLINGLGRVIDADVRVRDQLRVVFVPDYRVSLAERMIPAVDLSQQISTAGFEASGTGNMKLALNGALTVGTLDGANIEIREAVGDENFYLFGLTADEVVQARRDYDPRRWLPPGSAAERAVAWIADDRFAGDAPGVFGPLLDHLMDERDPYCVLADFESYRHVQHRAALDFGHADAWARKSGLNTARMGRFSSDRAVREYASRIWGIVGSRAGRDDAGD